MTTTLGLHPLEPQHRRELEIGSAIPSDLIDEEQIATLPDVGVLSELRPSECFRHPDPEKASRFGTLPPVRGGGIYLPIESWCEPGSFSWQVKFDRPRDRVKKDGTRDPIKYESPPGARLTIYAPRRIRRQLANAAIPLWLGEGIKKTLSAVGQGVCAVGLAGVDAWTVRLGESLSSVIPELAAIPFDGRLAFICFDSDAVTNDNVRAAEQRLKHELEARGAYVLVIRIPPGPGGEKVGLDDYIAAGGDIQALAGAAIVAALDAARTPPPPDPTPPDDDETDGLRAALREHKLADEMRRTRAFSAGEVEIARHYARAAASALSRGERTVSVWADDTTKKTGQSAATATRFHHAMRAFQNDPAVASVLPFKIATESDGKKDHISLVLADELDPARRSTADLLAPLSHLRRPDDRSSHGGARDRCPKCESPMLRTTQDRCTNDACNHVVVHKSKIVGRPPFHDETGSERSEIHGASYVTETSWTEPFHDETESTLDDDESEPVPPFHDETLSTLTLGKQDEMVSVAFVDDTARRLAKPTIYVGQELPPPIYPPEWAGTDRVCEQHGIPRLASGRCSFCERPPAPLPRRPLVVHELAPLSDRAWRRPPPPPVPPPLSCVKCPAALAPGNRVFCVEHQAELDAIEFEPQRGLTG